MPEGKTTWFDAKWVRWILPNLGVFIWCSLFIGAVMLGPRMMNTDGDLGRHLTIGADILETMSIPVSDRYSHTMMGTPLTPHEWLSQVLFALAEKAAGLNGVVILTALMVATSFWLVYRLALRSSGSLLFSLLFTILGAGASSLHWLTRPHIFTLFMSALWLNASENPRWQKKGGWVVFPLMMLAWVNLHGAFLVGFMIWGLIGVGTAWDQILYKRDPGKRKPFWKAYLLAGAGMGVASLVNPVGWRIWETSVGYVGNRYLVGHTQEYLPPNFHQPVTWAFLILIVLVVILTGWSGKRQRTEDLLLVGAWTAMGLYSLRNMPIYTLVAVPYLARCAADTWESLPGWRGFTWIKGLDQRMILLESRLKGVILPLGLVVLIGAALAAGIPLSLDGTGNTFQEGVFPVQAVNWLEQNPQEGKVFNYFPWGGYLLYRLWDDQLVFIDGQTDFYGEDLTRQYEQVITAQDGWESILRQYQVSWAILPAGETLVKVMANSGGWNVIYQDDTATVLVYHP